MPRANSGLIVIGLRDYIHQAKKTNPPLGF